MEIKKPLAIVDFEPISRRVLIQEKQNFYQILINSGIRITSLCGGQGKCGKCKIIIQQGFTILNPSTSIEKALLTQKEINQNYRLACQCIIGDNPPKLVEESIIPQVKIFLPEELLIENFKILTSGVNKGVNLKPSIIKKYLNVRKPNLTEPVADLERIIASLSGSIIKDDDIPFTFEIEYDALKKLPNILREQDHKITLTLWNDSKIIDCEAGDKTQESFGIAFDIGTTTIVGYLINLINGKIYALDSALNPQTAFGEDVVSRITYVKNSEESLLHLRDLVLDTLNKIIESTCKSAGITPKQIYETVIVGNSVMHHLFLGIDPSYIGLSPYVPSVQKGLNLPAKEVGLQIFPNANIYMLPLIAGYVGADTMGVIISSEIDKESELTLAIDVGTNGEIIIGNKEIIATGSCAAGSALEGAHITHGMRAASGAIDTVHINPKNFDVSYTTINNKEPLGICGSGLIDIIAEMLRSKIITRSGGFNKQVISHERFINLEKSFEFIIASKEETSFHRNITISQNDIRELQMAKGAFFCGTRLILQKLNELQKNDLKIGQIFLAGAFGNYINKNNAKFIGMIPDISEEKILQIGNAAGIGAQNCLLNRDLRDKAHQLLKSINYVEIAVQQNFQKEYAESMYFPHLKLNYFPSLKEYNEIPKR
ncbi:MAG: DUF4445 domain-containing protein [Candidatus Lokiarchaeota archaeon]|nr:DUF4445 domain-containing protein [Candidatus Lokiarchaeota archaeon]